MIRVKRYVLPVTFAVPPAGVTADKASAVDSALDQLRSDLQYAIALEHATIPPYLTALYSLLEGNTNSEIRGLIRSVVLQEMLHMALAANVLAAVGGTPSFTSPDFLPSYPNDLPFDIGDVQVPLAPFSVELVRDVFLKIEEPEHGAIPFPTEMALTEGTTYQTIGQFYAVIRQNLTTIAAEKPIFIEHAPQLLEPPGAFRIENLADALRALDLIVQQGEGTSSSPLQGHGPMLAHYYRFNEIVEGFALVRDPMTDLGYSYTGYPIPFAATGVIPIVTNAKMADYPAGSKIARYAAQFNSLYRAMLEAIESVYIAGMCNNANIVGLMIDMKIIAQRLTSLPIPESNPITYATPTFESANGKTTATP